MLQGGSGKGTDDLGVFLQGPNAAADVMTEEDEGVGTKDALRRVDGEAMSIESL